ncbi:hypothetical protein [Bdellovibrio sp.]|uniref:hypothetical protein n=1 Tax=Bdellovibrio sp. TaxID=28201 RepID=UPI0039E219B5
MKTLKFLTSCTFLSVLLFSAQGLTFPSMLSAESTNTMTFTEATNYCRNLSAPCDLAVDGSACGADTLKGWYLPSADELGRFVGLSSSESYLWTRSQYSEYDKYIALSLLDGSWGWAEYGAAVGARCAQ